MHDFYFFFLKKKKNQRCHQSYAVREPHSIDTTPYGSKFSVFHKQPCISAARNKQSLNQQSLLFFFHIKTNSNKLTIYCTAKLTNKIANNQNWIDKYLPG